MQIMLKHILKNIIAKPFRTLLLLFCIASFVFTAMLCIDMSGSLKYIVKSMLSQTTGTSDIIMADPMGLDEKLLSETDGITYDLVAERTSGFVTVPEGFGSYFHTDAFQVVMMDYETAGKMRLVREKISLDKNEAAVSEDFVKKYGIGKGDKLKLYSDEGKEINYEVKTVISNYGIVNGKEMVFLSREGFLKLDYDGEIDYGTAYIDVTDDAKTSETADSLRKVDIGAEVSVLLDGEELKAMSKLFTMIFLLMFSICFLLVIFVTLSVSKRIVNERMSVVGTFRSLGLSNQFTTGFLLAESSVYGVFGGVIGCVLYHIVRGLLYQNMIQVDSASAELQIDFGSVSILTYLLVILGAVMVECGCSLKEVVNAARVSIRDIIFDNKDTKYRGNRKAYIVGGILILTAVILLLCTKGMIPMILAFAAFIVALSLLFPLVLKYSSKLLSGIFERCEAPVMRLAAMEIYARKSTVGSSVLCVTTAALVIMLFIFAGSLSAVYDINTYNCDLHVTTNGDRKSAVFEYIENLDEVSDTEYLYILNRSVTLNDVEKDINVIGMPDEGFSMFTGVKNLPGHLEKDEFYMDKNLAEKAGAGIGDTVRITFDADSFLPTTKELKLSGYVDSYEVDTTSASILISKDMYVDIFHDYPGEILVRTGDAERTKSEIEKYSGTYISGVETVSAYNAGWQGKKKNMEHIILGIIALGVMLTVTGMVSNQLIGFDGRRRECAVLLSTAMDRGKLKVMFVVESMFATGTALICALPVSLICFIPFGRIMAMLGGGMRISYRIGLYAVFLVILWSIFTLVALFPVAKLRKMNIAAQLKYE